MRNRKELTEPEKKEEKPSIGVEGASQKGKKYIWDPMQWNKSVEEEKNGPTYVTPPAYDLPILYPQRVRQQKKKEQQEK